MKLKLELLLVLVSCSLLLLVVTGIVLVDGAVGFVSWRAEQMEKLIARVRV